MSINGTPTQVAGGSGLFAGRSVAPGPSAPPADANVAEVKGDSALLGLHARVHDLEQKLTSLQAMQRDLTERRVSASAELVESARAIKDLQARIAQLGERVEEAGQGADIADVEQQLEQTDGGLEESQGTLKRYADEHPYDILEDTYATRTETGSEYDFPTSRPGSPLTPIESVAGDDVAVSPEVEPQTPTADSAASVAEPEEGRAPTTAESIHAAMHLHDDVGEARALDLRGESYTSRVICSSALDAATHSCSRLDLSEGRSKAAALRSEAGVLDWLKLSFGRGKIAESRKMTRALDALDSRIQSLIGNTSRNVREALGEVSEQLLTGKGGELSTRIDDRVIAASRSLEQTDREVIQALRDIPGLDENTKSLLRNKYQHISEQLVTMLDAADVAAVSLDTYLAREGEHKPIARAAARSLVHASFTHAMDSIAKNKLSIGDLKGYLADDHLQLLPKPGNYAGYIELGEEGVNPEVAFARANSIRRECDPNGELVFVSAADGFLRELPGYAMFASNPSLGSTAEEVMAEGLRQYFASKGMRNIADGTRSIGVGTAPGDFDVKRDKKAGNFFVVSFYGRNNQPVRTLHIPVPKYPQVLTEWPPPVSQNVDMSPEFCREMSQSMASYCFDRLQGNRHFTGDTATEVSTDGVRSGNVVIDVGATRVQKRTGEASTAYEERLRTAVDSFFEPYGVAAPQIQKAVTMFVNQTAWTSALDFRLHGAIPAYATFAGSVNPRLTYSLSKDENGAITLVAERSGGLDHVELELRGRMMLAKARDKINSNFNDSLVIRITPTPGETNPVKFEVVSAEYRYECRGGWART